MSRGRPLVGGVLTLDLRSHVRGGQLEDTAIEEIRESLRGLWEGALVLVRIGDARQVSAAVLSSIAGYASAAERIQIHGDDVDGVRWAAAGLDQHAGR